MRVRGAYGGDRLVSVAGARRLPVLDGAGDRVGRLSDFVVLWTPGHPPITGVVVRLGRRHVFVHADDVGSIDENRVCLTATGFDLRDFVRRPGEGLLLADVLDHQLVDVDGVRVVRASDLYLALIGGDYRLVGVDVSMRSFLRRLVPGLAERFPKPERVLDWATVQSLAQDGGAIALRTPHRGLRALRPADVAGMLDELARPERQLLLSLLETEHAADVLEELHPRQLRSVLRDASADQAALLVSRMEPDEAAAALRGLSADEQDGILGAMDPAGSVRLRGLLGFPEDVAAGIMTTRLAVVRLDDTVADARAVAMQHREHPDVPALVVVDADGRLTDDLPIVDLLAVDPSTPIREVIAPPLPLTVPAWTPLGDVVEQLTANRELSILVVDDENRPIGRILADDVIDALMARGRVRHWAWQRGAQP